MNPRNTLVLAVLVAALGTFVYFWEIRGAEERAEAEEAEERLFADLEASDLRWMEVRTTDGSHARLERTEEGAWRITEPVDFPANETTARGLASALAGLASVRVFEEPEPPEAYGLAGEPTVRFGTDGAEHAVVVGDKTPLGGNTYVRSSESAPVYAVETSETNALRKELDALRDDRLLSFDRPKVRRIEVRWPEGAVTLAREGPDAAWRVTGPLDARADEETVDTLLSDLRFLRADGFLDDPPSDAEAGLDAPALEVRLRGAPEPEGGEGPLLAELAVGGPVGEGRLAARGKAEGTLYALSPSRLEAFPREVVAYRYKQLASFDPSRVVRFSLQLRGAPGEETLELEGRRTADGWRTEPERLAAGKAGRLVRELADLEASAIVAESMGESERAALGLAPPRVRIRAWTEPGEGETGSGPLVANVALGAADAERGIAAMRAEGDEIYRLDYALAEHLPVSLEALRNRFVSAEPSGTAEAGEGGASREVPASSGGPAPSGGAVRPGGGSPHRPAPGSPPERP